MSAVMPPTRTAPLSDAAYLLYDMAAPGMVDDDGRPTPTESWRHASTGELFTEAEIEVARSATASAVHAAFDQAENAVVLTMAELDKHQRIMRKAQPFIDAAARRGMDVTIGEALEGFDFFLEGLLKLDPDLAEMLSALPAETLEHLVIRFAEDALASVDEEGAR